jgi:hypothetical protein
MKNIYLALLSQYSCKCKEALRTEKYHRALTLRLRSLIVACLS